MLIFDQLKKNDPQLRLLTWIVLGGMGLLLVGLWYVQVISFRQYAENQKAQSFRTVRIPAIRGKILDRHGVPLAENQPSYNISLYLEELREQFREEWRRTRPAGRVPRSVRLSLEGQARYRVVSNIVLQLGAALQQPVGVGFEQFIRHYTNQLALPMPVLSGISPAQLARFQEQPGNPPGLDLEVQPQRHYPLRTTAAHVVGYMVRDDSSAQDEDAFFNYRLPDYRGRVGIEGAFDHELRGRAGVKSVLVNNLGYRQSENIWTPAEPGDNVHLTLDVRVQQEAEHALHSALPNVRGAVVVMDPNTGDLLALVSAPAYDPNQFIPRISPEDWARLSDETLKPQRNRATQETYAPGSIFKVLIAMAALENGLDPQRLFTVEPDPARPNKGCIFVGRRKIEDTAPAGQYDFRRGFIRSSNAYFITNGLRAGVENIIRLGQKLRLGERSGLPTFQDSPGILPSLRRVRTGWFDGDTANLCIGQGELAVTPLQMAVMVAAIANGGKVLTPRLVERLEPQEPALAGTGRSFPPAQVREELGVSARTLRLIRDAMLADVEDREEGTGRLAAVPGLRICAKTGTAQVTDPNNKVVDHTTWFASYAPFEQPRYVVLVMVESGASGGYTCAPVARKIYEALLRLESEPRSRGPILAEKW